jgi:hypothetical protein
VVSLASKLAQLPFPPFVGVETTSQGSPTHVAEVNCPSLQELNPDTVNPLLHIGWHVDPLEIEFAQLPTPPSSGAKDAEQFVEQVAAVKMPNELQELDPVGVKPTLHVGVQVEPRDIASVQFPKAPFTGVTDASHAIRIHAPGGPLYMLVEAVYAPVHTAASQSS